MHAMPAAAATPASPWRSMWFSPRVTIRRIIDSKVRRSWVPVVSLAAVNSALVSMKLDPDTGTLSASLSAMPVIIGVLQLFFGVLVGPFLLAFVGGWLGGEGDPADIREAVAWSYVPIAAGVPLWVPLLLVFGPGAFGTDRPPESGTAWPGILMVLGIALCYFWSVPLLVGGLAEVQRFSIGKSILSLVILSIPLVLLSAIG